MLKELSDKHALTELLEIEGCPLAIADQNQKFVWYNKSFKLFFGQKKIKGKTIFDLFEVTQPSNFKTQKNSRSTIIPLPLSKKNLSIKVLKSDSVVGGYLVYLIDAKEKVDDEKDSEQLHKVLLFQKELKDILNLLVNERSLDKLSKEVLQRGVDITGSDFGFIVYLEEKKLSFLIHDPLNFQKNKKETEKEIQSNFSFIKKWFEVNHRPLLALNIPNNIGFNLAHSLEVNALITAPCFVEEKLVAAIIVAKKNKNFSAIEVNNIEQFATLLSFIINSIRTGELNTALENSLRQAQKLETIGKLTSGMAHDFNNLLSSIFGSLNLLKKRVPDNENTIRLIDNIESCAIRAKDLTKGLLSYGKPTPKRKELIKPNSLLSEISKVITQTFPKNIHFESKIENNLYDILGNSTEIYQILLNLCVNAKEAIEGEGKITLSGRNITVDEKNIINFPVLEKGNYVEFSVSDTGAGIKEENLSQIFDPYFSTKEKETGSGLGLYVTYGIIKAHKGHIEVSSVLNEGTTFDVYIPAYEPETESEKVSPSEKIILLADDEIMLRDLLAELLESNGYNVIKVTSGIEALKVLTEEIKVDLVIIDYNMPEMNGLECINEIRKLNFKMPIILSSGSLYFEENINLKKSGISSLVTKPYEFDTMLSTIQKLI